MSSHKRFLAVGGSFLKLYCTTSSLERSMTLQPHSQTINGLTWTTNNNVVATVSYDGTFALCLVKGTLLTDPTPLDPKHAALTCAAISKTSTFILCGGDNGFYLYHLRKRKLQFHRSDIPHITCLALSADEKYAAFGDREGGVWVYSFASQDVRAIQADRAGLSPSRIRAIRFCRGYSQTTQFTWAEDSGAVGKAEAVSGRAHLHPRAHTGPCTGLCFVGDSSQYVTGGWDGYLRFWDISCPGSALHEVEMGGRIAAVSASAGGKVAVAVGQRVMLTDNGGRSLGTIEAGFNVTTLEWSWEKAPLRVPSTAAKTRPLRVPATVVVSPPKAPSNSSVRGHVTGSTPAPVPFAAPAPASGSGDSLPHAPAPVEVSALMRKYLKRPIAPQTTPLKRESLTPAVPHSAAPYSPSPVSGSLSARQLAQHRPLEPRAFGASVSAAPRSPPAAARTSRAPPADTSPVPVKGAAVPSSSRVDSPGSGSPDTASVVPPRIPVKADRRRDTPKERTPVKTKASPAVVNMESYSHSAVQTVEVEDPKAAFPLPAEELLEALNGLQLGLLRREHRQEQRLARIESLLVRLCAAAGLEE
eukprot:gnl/Dysnectes_brevis/2917_a3575_469.p1 GENE.gnl/Dysnectes_brevis/2917_a3575_469~~gnl/Dysnectes_brevis/2917_a3575_469.p1  ORF type:complete len:595 (-),score=168.72 gnl/Dysnectes_brevis/2917_a3575_469:43-1800(-)